MDRQDLVSLFGIHDQEPGTFTIAERRSRPRFLSESERGQGYRAWIEWIVQRDITLLRRMGNLDVLKSWNDDDLVGKTVALLDLPLPDGRPLCEAVPNQIYSDVVRRAIMYLLYGDSSRIVHTFEDANRQGHQTALYILADPQPLTCEERLKRAVLAGIVSLDQKDTASATSHIVKSRVIPTGPAGSPRALKDIREDLMVRVSEDEWGINCWEDFETEVLKCARDISIAWLTDDYIETVFDLDVIQALLNAYPHVSVCVAPRRSQYGNDASYLDVMGMLAEPRFSSLQSNSRFEVCENGSFLGTVDPRAIPRGLAEVLLAADCLVVKGARTYEMLQGINKLTYYSFSVTREISETVTGIDATLASPVFIRQAPGEHSFSDFRASAWRRIRFPSGRMAGLAGTTACEYVGQERCTYYCMLESLVTSDSAGG